MICTHIDELEYEDRAIWIATLEDKTQVYQNCPDAWFKLQKYLLEENKRIQCFHLKFRSHIVALPQSQKGYYLSKGVGKWGGSSKAELFIVYGHVVDDILIKDWYKTPELIRRPDNQVREALNKEILESILYWPNNVK